MVKMVKMGISVKLENWFVAGSVCGSQMGQLWELVNGSAVGAYYELNIVMHFLNF